MTGDAPGTAGLPFLLSRLRRWRLVFLSVFVAIAGTGLALAALLPAVYRAEALVLVESEQTRTDAVEQLQIIEQRVLTRDVLVDLAERLRIYAAEGRADEGEVSPGTMLEDLRSRILIEPSEGDSRSSADTETGLVRIGFYSSNPEVAAAVANEIAALILKDDVATRGQLARQTQTFFQQQVARLEKEVSARSAEIQGYKEANISALPESLMFRRQDLAMIEDRLMQLDRERRTLLDQIERLGKDQPGLAGREEAAPFRETSPMTARDLRREDLIAELSDLDEARTELAARAEVLTETIAKTPRVAIRLEALERDYQNIRSQYDLAIANLARSEVGEVIENLADEHRISVIEQAVRPERPFSPHRIMIALVGLVVAVASAAGLILLLEMVRTGVRRPQDIRAAAGDYMILTLPHVPTRRERAMNRVLGGIAIAVCVAIALGLWQNAEEAGRLLAGGLDRISTILPLGWIRG